MKNKIRNIFFFAGLATVIFSACTEDYPEREPSYVPASDCMNVYFPTSNEGVVEVEQTVNEVVVTLSREKTDKAATIALKNIDKNGVFEVPETVSFTAGQKDAEITVKFENLVPFVQYSVLFSLEESYTNPYKENETGTTNFQLNVTQADWKDYAEGSFTSWFFEDTWPQNMQYSETLKMYRLKGLWVSGYNYMFKWDGGDKIQPAGSLSGGLYVQPSGYVHPTYGMVSTNTSATDSKYDSATKTFTFNIKWTVSAGSFGVGDEVYVVSKVL